MLHKTNIEKTKMKNRQIIFTVGYFTYLSSTIYLRNNNSKKKKKGKIKL